MLNRQLGYVRREASIAALKRSDAGHTIMTDTDCRKIGVIETVGELGSHG